MGSTRTWILAIVLLVGVVLFTNTTTGRRWIEDRIDTILSFINAVRSLHPWLAP